MPCPVSRSARFRGFAVQTPPSVGPGEAITWMAGFRRDSCRFITGDCSFRYCVLRTDGGRRGPAYQPQRRYRTTATSLDGESHGTRLRKEMGAKRRAAKLIVWMRVADPCALYAPHLRRQCLSRIRWPFSRPVTFLPTQELDSCLVGCFRMDTFGARWSSSFRIERGSEIALKSEKMAISQSRKNGRQIPASPVAVLPCH